jgi:hypothetical protein
VWQGAIDELLVQITFGANDDARDVRNTTKIDDLVVYDLYHLERVPGGNRVDQYIAMYTDSVL